MRHNHDDLVRTLFCIAVFKIKLAVLLLALAPLAVAAQPPADNLQRLSQLFDRVAWRVADAAAPDSAAVIWIKSPAIPKPEERFFYSRLLTILTDSLRFAVFAEPVDSLKTLALTYQLSRCEIVYQPLPRRRFWRPVRWRRTANVVAEVGALDPRTQQVRFQKIFVETAADTLSEKSLSGGENQNFVFTLGRREDRQESSRWLEPVLITSATGVVVYLFYALRSR